MTTHWSPTSKQRPHGYDELHKPSPNTEFVSKELHNENRSEWHSSKLSSEVADPPKYTITIMTQARLQSLIVNACQTGTSRFGDDLDAIKEFVLEEVGAYLLDVDIADKRIDQAFDLLNSPQTPSIRNNKYFAITNLFTPIKSAQDMQAKSERIVNKIFSDLKSISANIGSLHKAKEIDLQTGFPILSWFLDMYSRDRIANAFNINPSFSRRYDVNRWFNDNLFARYVSHTHPEIALKLKQGMITLSKYVLPPIELRNIRYNIADKLNGIARYVIASNQFIQSVIDEDIKDQSVIDEGVDNQSIDEKWQPIFPMQIDFKIIPRQVKQSRPGSFEQHLKDEFYFPQQDYFKEIATRLSVEDLAQQFKRMWKDKGAGKKDSHQRYLFVIDRQSAKDTIYLIKPQAKPWPTICDEYFHICESLLYTSQTDATLGSVNDYSISLSYHVFQVDYIKSYCHFGVNGAALFELNDMVWLWGKYFKKMNGQPQRLNKKYLEMINNTKKLPNIQFDEFSKQSHDESNEKLKVGTTIDPTQNDVYDNIEAMGQEIVRVLRIQFDEQLADELKELFSQAIIKNRLKNIEAITKDLRNIKQSTILGYIWNNMAQSVHQSDRQRIGEALQSIVNCPPDVSDVFDIKDLTFSLMQKDVTDATKYVRTECPDTFIHPNLTGPLDDNLHRRANIAEDKSMCITKAVDFKNGYPILKWFCDTFCRDRIHGHQTIYETYAVPFYKYKYHRDKYAAGYNATSWWLHDSPYCKYIQHQHASMARPMMTAIQAFCKRILPPMNLDWSAGNIIHDNLNSFAEYTMACYGFVHELTQNEAQAMPFQLDFCIIPQLATPVSYDKDGKLRFNRMGIWNKATKEVAHPIWRITELLKQAHYAQDRDFVCEDAQDTVSKLQKQLHQMWKTLRADLGKCRRYVLVIDRRNPKNLDEKDMRHEPPRYWKQTKDWTDRIYLIAPKCAHKMSKKVRSIQELFFAYSKQYLLPQHIGRNIGIDDALNGYKFALSFHILDHNTSSVYFYNNKGGVTFELLDIEWLWPRFFHRFSRNVQSDNSDCVTEHGEQKLSDKNRKLLRKYHDTKRLVDIKFEEFWGQSHAI
eukprot:494414_1